MYAKKSRKTVKKEDDDDRDTLPLDQQESSLRHMRRLIAEGKLPKSIKGELPMVPGILRGIPNPRRRTRH
jgi:hypothetical protein